MVKYLKYFGIIMILSTYGCKKMETVDCETFHQLVAANNVELVNDYLENGMAPNCTINAKVTPLMTAAVYDRTQIIESLIKHKADVNLQTESGWTALLYASENGNLESVKLLLKNGADINKTLKGGENAFLQACFKGHPEVAEYLLKHGADVNVSDNQIGLNGLILASDLGDLNLVKQVLPLTKDINHQNKYGETAFMRAAMKGHYSVLMYLSEKGADKNIKDSFGNDALFYTKKFGHPELEKFLTQK
jgi:uncharacterized protein